MPALFKTTPIFVQNAGLQSIEKSKRKGLNLLNQTAVVHILRTSVMVLPPDHGAPSSHFVLFNI